MNGAGHKRTIRESAILACEAVLDVGTAGGLADLLEPIVQALFHRFGSGVRVAGPRRVAR